ncbi:MAG TPA: hypothetical protein VF093_03215 [Solirubrobacterales bacterium]
MTRALGGFRRRAVLAVAISFLAAIATATVLSGAAADPRSPEDPMERMVLRLNDLPHGYLPLDFSEGSGFELICEPLDPTDPQRELASFVRRFTPEGCLGVYLRLYRVPGASPSAQLVGTGALDAGSAKGATSGFALAPMILRLITEDEAPTEVATTISVGDATRLFHWPRVPSVLGKGYRAGSFLVWRSGNVLATVLASAGSFSASDHIAEELARHQQAHIEHPTPYTRAERNDSEVGLDDPALKLPVYWLGRNFAPGHDLPVARLEYGGDSRYDSERLPGERIELRYSHNLNLSTWAKAGWKRFLATPAAKEILAEPCLKSTRLPFAGGRATIYTGHVAGFPPCRTHAPKRSFAVVHLGDVVTAVNIDTCRDCRESPRGSFNSQAGMKAVVRALRLRPAPEY